MLSKTACSIREISEILDMSERNVYYLISKLRKKVQVFQTKKLTDARVILYYC